MGINFADGAAELRTRGFGPASLSNFEPSICSIFQGAEKGALRQNQVFLMALGDGPRWY